MNVLQKLKFGAVALSLATVFTACSSDDDATPSSTEGTLKISAKAEYQKAMSRAGENVTLSKFIVNFKEIELERNDDEDDVVAGSYGSDDDVELKGPFLIDLLSGKSIQLINIKVPNGIYKEIEFEFDKSEDNTSDMLGKSMKMTGEINGKPFIFWHDFEDEIEIDFEDDGKNLVVNNNTQEIFINFDLNAVINMVDLSTATDKDGDGVITISPNDEDGNRSLAKVLKEAIKAQIELMED